MDVATFWDQVRSALGLDEPRVAETVAGAIQVLAIVLLTVVIARWVGAWVRRAAIAGRIYAEVATLMSRAATIAVYAVGGTVVLAIVGTSWTAIATILGAATFGISLALQDVGRGFVNGVYILVERPFRIGDHVRIGAVEGRVEEVGIRLTTLRTAAGDRIIVPNTVVFASVIENSSVGTVDRQKYAALGIERPATEIPGAVIASLQGIPHLSPRAPVVEIIRSSPDGADIEVTVEHDLGIRIDDLVIERLRSLFPEATVATKSSAGAL